MPGPLDPDAAEILVFTRERAREVDRLAVSEFGIPSIVLMENAAIHLGGVALERLGESGGESALIVCGPGNNGGDGLAAARHLHNAGVRVAVVLSAAADRYAGDAATHLRIVERMGPRIFEAEAVDPAGAVKRAAASLGGPGIVIDALLGTGLDRPVSESMAAMIGAINSLGDAGLDVLAVDVPSGLDADSGRPLGVAVRADATVSFVGLKAGFLSLGALEYVGDIRVAEIGAPRELVSRLGDPVPSDFHDLDLPRGGRGVRSPRADRPDAH